MEDIYLDKKIEVENIKERLLDLFPDLAVFYYDFNNDSPSKLDSNNPNRIFFNTSYHEAKLEFGFVISIYGTSDKNSQERGLFIAKAFSDFYGVRVLAPFTNPDKPDDPFYDIVFENGKIFLADDCDTSFGDNSNGLVKILGEYPLKNIRFDKKAQLINE